MSNYRCPDCGKEGLNASTFLFHDGCKSADQKPAAGPRVWLINSLDEGDDGPAVFIHGPDAHMVEVVEKSYADRLEQELAFVKTQWKQTSDLLEQERNRLTAELADVRKERDEALSACDAARVTIEALNRELLLNTGTGNQLLKVIGAWMAQAAALAGALDEILNVGNGFSCEYTEAQAERGEMELATYREFLKERESDGTD